MIAEILADAPGLSFVLGLIVFALVMLIHFVIQIKRGKLNMNKDRNRLWPIMVMLFFGILISGAMLGWWPSW
jgi:H+/Cl- antiporter ClcA